MAGKYVLDGAKIKCPLCSKKEGTLKVTSNKVQLQDHSAATEGDNGKQNLQFQGNCTHPQFSGGPPPPCKSVISVAQWQNTSETKFDDQKALVEGSQIMCQTGGVPITIKDTTQKATPTNLAAMDAAAAPVPGGSRPAEQPAQKVEANYNSFVTDEPVETGLKGDLTVRGAYFARKKETQKYKPQTTNYPVEQGDTLSSIAAQFDTSVAKIAEASKIEDVSSIEVGQQLRVPHQVKDGKEVRFERLAGATLGQEVYIVVTYMGEIDSGTVELVEKEALLSDGGSLPVLQDGSETSRIELQEPEEERWQGYRMVAKVTLRPESDDQLDEWRDKLKTKDGETKKSLLSIKVTAEGGKEVDEVKYRGKNNSNVFLAEEGEWFKVDGQCQRCKELTMKELDKVFTDGSEDEKKQLMDTFNEANEKFGLDTCQQKAHFFAQILEEVGSSINISNGESLNYSAKALPNYFTKFSKTGQLGGPPNDLAYKYGRSGQNNYTADEEMIANIAYANRGGNGDKDSGDGWKYRGRGIIQITFKNKYDKINSRIESDYPDFGVEIDANNINNIREGTIASMAYWKEYNCQAEAAKGVARENLDAIVDIINKHTPSRDDRWKNLQNMIKVFKVKECTK